MQAWNIIVDHIMDRKNRVVNEIKLAYYQNNVHKNDMGIQSGGNIFD